MIVWYWRRKARRLQAKVDQARAQIAAEKAQAEEALAKTKAEVEKYKQEKAELDLGIEFYRTLIHGGVTENEPEVQ